MSAKHDDYDDYYYRMNSRGLLSGLFNGIVEKLPAGIQGLLGNAV